eukprot:5270399-Pyramimonas_sp.AAC.1
MAPRQPKRAQSVLPDRSTYPSMAQTSSNQAYTRLEAPRPPQDGPKWPRSFSRTPPRGQHPSDT